MAFTNCELLLSPDPFTPAVVVGDLPATHAGALVDAVSYLRRVRYDDALDTDAVLALRAVIDLMDRLVPAPDAQMHVLRLTGDDAATLTDAINLYITDRDVDSYQPPEERARISRLRELAGPLSDASGRLMLATLDADDEQPALR